MTRARALVLALTLAGCGGGHTPAPVPTSDADCCIFVDTQNIPGDFIWRQRVAVRYRERHESFQAVIEKQGNRLVLLALTPFGTRAFALEQVGITVTFTAFVDLELAFPPRYILAGVHRTFFRGLPTPNRDGLHQGVANGERIIERWVDQRLMHREYAPLAAESSSSVLIDYVTGMSAGTPPREVRFEDRRYGYSLIITTLLNPSP